MTSRFRLRGIIGVVVALQVIALLTKMEEWSLIRKIDKTTQSNAVMLTIHGSTLYAHEQNFEAILEGTFSKEFAAKIKRNIDAQK